MKAYKINTIYTTTQPHLVIANCIGDAETIFLSKYKYSRIESIELIAEYVLVQGVEDE